MLYKPDAIRALPLSELRYFSDHYTRHLVEAKNDYKRQIEIATSAAREKISNKTSQSGNDSKQDQPRESSHNMSSELKISLAEKYWNKHKPGTIREGALGSNIITLLTLGASDTISKPDGWLELETETQAKDLIQKLSIDLDIYVGRISDDPGLDPTFGGFLGETFDNLKERGTQVSASNVSSAEAELTNMVALINNRTPCPTSAASRTGRQPKIR
ncbi:hypothetical protein NJ284_13215 [Xanthomonas citri pv. anacardii]|uniref:hypothetical protein n=1 Tax=Xanthomonas citri TaxID=346 RepID=UPI0032DB1EED